MKKQELDYKAKSNLFTWQDEIKPSARAVLIDWLLEVSL
jgi:hypothetical protein